MIEGDFLEEKYSMLIIFTFVVFLAVGSFQAAINDIIEKNLTNRERKKIYNHSLKSRYELKKNI